MKIAFITDLHIGTEEEMPRGVDVRRNLLDILAYVTEMKPACLVVGGDLCFETGDRAIYQWIKGQLDQLPFQYFLLSGNHDDSTLLAEELHLTHELQEGELYYAHSLEGRPTLFLDTAKGRMSERQWTWLREHLQALRQSNVLIFMHHPPFKAGVGHMDTYYPFEQSDELMALLQEIPCQVTVVCGHYHVEKVLQQGNVNVLITPSLFFQMKHEPVEMIIEHYRIAVRELNLTLDGQTSTVHYLEGNRVPQPV